MRARTLKLLAWLLLTPVVWVCIPASAMQTVVPVASKVTGSVTVQTSRGLHLDVVKSRLLHSGDTVFTGPNSLASIDLADVGRVIVGPSSNALTRLAGSGLSVQISSGLLCVESQTAAVAVSVGALRVSAATAPTIFNVVRTGGATTVAVYQGSIALAMHGSKAGALQTGQATISSNDEAPTPVALATVNSTFSSLHCPDDGVVKEALKAGDTPAAAAATAPSGGHGGGLLGWILGIAAIAAAGASHGGGAASTAALPPSQDLPSPSTSPGPSSTPTVKPTSTPTSSPTPSPTSTSTSSPDTISVDPASLSFSSTDSDPKSFKAEDAAARNYFASSSNPEVATVLLDDQHGHEARFDVAPGGVGSATITVSDDAGHRGTVSVSVASGDLVLSSHHPTTCALVVSANNLVFAGTMSSQRVLVSAPCKRGIVRARSSNVAVASIDPPSTTSSVQGFIVTARSAGSAVLLLSADLGTLQIIRVTVLGPHPARVRVGP